MYVCVGHFESEDCLANLHAWEGLADGKCHFLGKDLKARYLVVFHIKDIVDLTTRDAKGMALSERVDIEKCIELFVLGALVTWYFALGDFCEY
jgi:hypothetical protein